jgi:aryl-alcohol dehydrogenase-like predicted oxidoreductase
MQYRQLGNSGIEVPVLGLGGWTLGGSAYGAVDRDTAVTAMRTAFDLGITLIDGAPYYGETETWFGEEFRTRRHEVFLITKSQRRPYTKANLFDNIEGSLKNLRTDYADLYVIFPDVSIPIDEILDGLIQVKKSGKARAVGVTNWDSCMLQASVGKVQLATNQLGYSLFDRYWQKTVFPTCEELGIGVMAYSPLAQGLLSGAITVDTKLPPDDVRSHNNLYAPENLPTNLTVVERLREFASERGLTLSQLALAWTLTNPLVSMAIIGTRRPNRLVEDVGALDAQLTPVELARLESIVANISGVAPRFG